MDSPSQGWIKINFDVAIRELSSITSLLAHNEFGKIILVAAQKLYYTEPNLSEALATLFTINTTLNEGWEFCIFKGDSQVFISALNGSIDVPLWNIEDCIANVFSKLPLFLGWQFYKMLTLLSHQFLRLKYFTNNCLPKCK